MKKLLALVAGLLLLPMAEACNMDVQNCIDFFTPDIMKYNNELKGNAVFKNDAAAWNAWQNKTQEFKQRVELCSTNKCTNQAFLTYHNYVINLVKKYRPLAEAQAAPAKAADKWADQCVVGAKPNVYAYADENGVTKTSVKVSEYTGYKVTKARGGPLVALVDTSSGQAVGWAKKAELQLQDLRNCN